MYRELSVKGLNEVPIKGKMEQPVPKATEQRKKPAIYSILQLRNVLLNNTTPCPAADLLIRFYPKSSITKACIFCPMYTYMDKHIAFSTDILNLL